MAKRHTTRWSALRLWDVKGKALGLPIHKQAAERMLEFRLQGNRLS